MKQLTLHSEAYRYCIASFKEWLQTIGYSEQTVYQLPNYVQEFLFYAEARGYAGLHQITNELIKQYYYKAMQLRDRAMLSIFYGCGLRRNEVYHLDISDIFFEKSVVHVRKGKGYKERIVPITKQCLGHLQNYLYDARPYFCNDRNEA